MIACIALHGRYHASMSCARRRVGWHQAIVTTPERARARGMDACGRCWTSRGYVVEAV